MSKGQLSLEYIVKVLILMVVIVVVISLIVRFSDDIKNQIIKFFGSQQGCNIPFPAKPEEKDTFNSKEIATHIESCYSTMTSCSEENQKDIVCYTLLAKNNIIATESEVRASLSQEINDKTEIKTDFSGSWVKIEFQDVGNKIIVTG